MRDRAFAPIATVVTVLTLIAGVIVAACAVLGVKPLIMQTGSMSPDIPTGALVLAKETPIDTLTVGQVVAHQRVDDGMMRVHRVVDINNSDGTRSVWTAGDVTGEIDTMPITEASTYIGEIVWTSVPAGFVWQVAPYVLAMLAVAVVLAALLPAEAAFGALGLLAALGLALGNWRTGALVGIEPFDVYIDPATERPVMDGALPGIVPAAISAPDGGTLAVQPGQLFTVHGAQGAGNVEISARVLPSWQLAVLTLIPAVFVLSARALNMLRRR